MKACLLHLCGKSVGAILYYLQQAVASRTAHLSWLWSRRLLHASCFLLLKLQVVLVTRDADKWYESANETIYALYQV
jgi:hypothetical protein